MRISISMIGIDLWLLFRFNFVKTSNGRIMYSYRTICANELNSSSMYRGVREETKMRA